MPRRWVTGLCVLGILALWVADVAALAPVVSNGFWEMSSAKTFHVALWLALACFIVIALGYQ